MVYRSGRVHAGGGPASEACQQAALSDPDLYCDFTTVSTSTPPSEAYEICDDPTGDVATICDEAPEVITDPEDRSGPCTTRCWPR